MIKIAVYAICKNEVKHVERFLESCRDADCVLVCDTGSTDGTWEKLRRYEADTRSLTRPRFTNVLVHHVSIRLWRFDDARNTTLALLPDDVDVCIPLDLDEVLVDGWRGTIERAWMPGTTRLRYPFVWNWKLNGSPGTTFYQDKIHARHGYRWRLPVHEIIVPDRIDEHIVTVHERLVEHRADDSKSRADYLPLLELAAREAPEDDRVAHYLGRELMFRGRHGDAIRELERHLGLEKSRWQPERAASMRFIARCYSALGDQDRALGWARHAVRENPSRETFVELALRAHDCRHWSDCLYASERALSIKQRPDHYICDPEAWGARPHDLLSVAAWNLGKVELALEHARIAADLEPWDERLKSNVEIIEKLESAGELSATAPS